MSSTKVLPLPHYGTRAEIGNDNKIRKLIVISYMIGYMFDISEACVN